MTVKRLRRNGWTLLGTVASDTEPDVEYEIRRRPIDGHVGCACMGYAFSNESPKTCRHLRAWGLEPMGPPTRVRADGIGETVMTMTEGPDIGETFTVKRAFALGCAMPDYEESPKLPELKGPTQKDVDALLRTMRLYLPPNQCAEVLGHMYRSRVAELDAGFKNAVGRLREALGKEVKR